MDHLCERCDKRQKNKTSNLCNECDKSNCIVCNKLISNSYCVQIYCERCYENTMIMCSSHSNDIVAFWKEYDCTFCAKNREPCIDPESGLIIYQYYENPVVIDIFSGCCNFFGELRTSFEHQKYPIRIEPDYNKYQHRPHPCIIYTQNNDSRFPPDLNFNAFNFVSQKIISKGKNTIIEYTTSYGRIFRTKCNNQLELEGDSWKEYKCKFITVKKQREIWRLNCGHKLYTKKTIYCKLLLLYRHCANMRVPDDIAHVIISYYRILIGKK